MNRERAITLLTGCKSLLAERFGVTRLALFGSTLRNTARDGSDVDILVEFEGPATSARYFGVQFYLEDLLGCPVDIAWFMAIWVSTTIGFGALFAMMFPIDCGNLN